MDGFDTGHIEVAGTGLSVALAVSPAQRAQGLQGVDALPDDIDGMLFEWAGATATSFHMRNTSIPLDIWWFDESGTLLGTTEMEPCPGDDCPSHRSPGPVVWALETPRGVFDFATGSALELP